MFTKELGYIRIHAFSYSLFLIVYMNKNKFLPLSAEVGFVPQSYINMCFLHISSNFELGMNL